MRPSVADIRNSAYHPRTQGGRGVMSKSRNGIAAALLAASFMSSPVLAQGAPQSEPIDLAAQQDKLKPGEWVWAPQLAPDGPVLVYVNLNRQMATVFRNGVRIGVSTVSSGKPGH